MTHPPTGILPDRNAASQRKHRRELLWQIIVPAVVGGLILAGLGVLSGLASDTQVSQGASAALIWLIVPQLLLCLVGIGLVSAILFGAIQLTRGLPVYSFRLQNGIARIGTQIQKLSDQLTEPVLRVHSGVSSIHAFWNSLLRMIGIRKRIPKNEL